jgi:predicted acyl esterase
MQITRAGRRVGMAMAALLATTLSLPALEASAGTGGNGGIGGVSVMKAGGSIEEAWLTGATAGDTIDLHDGSGVVASGTADEQGSLIVRNITPGSGYYFEDTTLSSSTSTFSVLDRNVAPAASLYQQNLKPGLNYVTMRDGIKIAMTLRLPPGKTLADGPFPTVMEYSGYAVAPPHSLLDAVLGKGKPNDKLVPSSSTMLGALIAPAIGYASVSVQMRGSGCSGGAFDLFGFPSDYDGYDAIETIAAQPWTMNHKVGMVGISYSGISQFEVAGTQPPHLAAIAPLSPTDDLFSTGYPGGIYNTGFAKGWINERIHDAKPALVDISGSTVTPVDADNAQEWTYAQIAAEVRRSVAKTSSATSTCLDNQALHGQSESLSTLVGPDLVRDPSLFDRRSPEQWAHLITVPVFVSGALQDEQTGPQWPSLISALSADKNVYATMINGGHIDSLGPATMSRMIEFLDIYVGKQVPQTRPILGLLAPGIYAGATGGAPAMAVPAIRFTDAPSPKAARSAFKASNPRVRVLFENGGTGLGAGSLAPAYEAGFSAWPPAGQVTTFNLSTDSSLTTGTASAGSVIFGPDGAARPPTSMWDEVGDRNNAGSVWAARPAWNWTTVPEANGIGFETPPLTEDMTIVGPASLHLRIDPDIGASTDLQATITEVRDKRGAANKEVYVTSGFLRSDFRTLLGSTTSLWTVPDYSAATGDLTPSTWNDVSIPISPIAHTFRAGTRLRVVITAPGGDRPSWTFDSPRTMPTAATVDLGGSSSLVVNVVSGVQATNPAPKCGSLRGEPCRLYTSLPGSIK